MGSQNHEFNIVCLLLHIDFEMKKLFQFRHNLFQECIGILIVPNNKW